MTPVQILFYLILCVALPLVVTPAIKRLIIAVHGDDADTDLKMMTAAEHLQVKCVEQQKREEQEEMRKRAAVSARLLRLRRLEEMRKLTVSARLLRLRRFEARTRGVVARALAVPIHIHPSFMRSGPLDHRTHVRINSLLQDRKKKS